jgi:alpha-L-fucosidase
MRIGFYYSLLDWRWPAYWDGPEKDPEGFGKVRDYVHAQVRELMTQYGKIDILWYDGSWPHSAEDWQSVKLNEMARSLQPEIIINNRSGLPADLETPEQHIKGHDRPWETCMTMDDLWWGYHPGDANLKSPMQLVRNLVKCVENGGNFLLNVGPKADGTIPGPQADRLREIGKWMNKFGDSIYGAGSSIFNAPHLGHTTAKPGVAYIHTTCWPGEVMTVAGIGNEVTRAYMVDTGRDLPFEQVEDRLFVRGLPRESPDPVDTVVALNIEGEPRATEASFWKD